MARKRASASRFKHLLRDSTPDRELADIFAAAVLAGDAKAARKVHSEMQSRDDHGIYNRKKFPLSDEVYQRWGALQTGGRSSNAEALDDYEEPAPPPKRKQAREVTITVDNDSAPNGSLADARRELARIFGRR